MGMNKAEKAAARKQHDKHNFEVKWILKEFTVLRAGWEMDNKGWIAQLMDGRVVILLTNHGSRYIAEKEEVFGYIKEHSDALAEMGVAMALYAEKNPDKPA